jgi:hypothetical protein
MSTQDFIIELFCRVDDAMLHASKHRQARLWPSEVVTLGLLYSLKGGGERAFYRWLTRDWRSLFPHLPERTRLFRLFKSHQHWTDLFLAQPTVLGVADSYGIELIHPIREGRRKSQVGRKTKSNRRWVVGGKLAFTLNQWGLIVAWEADAANRHDNTLHGIIDPFADSMLVLTDHGFFAKDGNPPNMKVCERDTWNVRMLVETVLSMLTTVCHLKHMSQRVLAYFKARLAFTVALFNLLVQWHGLTPDDDGFVQLSIAEFSL